MVGSIAYFTIATIIQTMSAKSTAVAPVAPAIVENAEYDVPDFYTAVWQKSCLEMGDVLGGGILNQLTLFDPQ